MLICRVYWGSHGCMLERGHEGHHICECSFDDETGELLRHMKYDTDDTPEDKSGNVGMFPYYGPGTVFYGEDAPT